MLALYHKDCEWPGSQLETKLALRWLAAWVVAVLRTKLEYAVRKLHREPAAHPAFPPTIDV